MKRFLVIILLVSQGAFAQTNVSRTIEVRQGQKVIMDFPYADLVNLRGWNGSTIEISADVLINLGKNDDSYEVQSQERNGVSEINGTIRDYENIPEMITLMKDGQLYYFETDDWNSPEIHKFYEEYGREGINWVSHGVARTITLDIKIPQNIGSLEISSKFGLIDVEGLNLALKASSTHGGVDVAISALAKNDFVLDSEWGTIYSNLDLEFKKKSGFEKADEWNHLECSMNGGGGTKTELISIHGNIYLRKE